MSPGFAFILLGALVLSGLLSWLQHRAYIAATRALAEEFRGNSSAILVSGRGKGWNRGAVVLLVIDSRQKRIIGAQAMAGITVLARFRPHPELLGGLASAPNRAGDVKMVHAVEQAVEQYKIVLRNRRNKPVTA